MDKLVFQIKQSTLHPLSSLLKDKGSLIAGGACVLIISTFFSTLISWSLTFHSLNQSILHQQGSNIDRQQNVTSALASAIMKMQESQHQMLGRLQMAERSMEMYVSKAYVDSRYDEASKLSSRMNATVYETKGDAAGLLSLFNDFKNIQTDFNRNTTDELSKINEDDKSQTATMEDLVTSIEALKAQGLETAGKQITISNVFTNLQSNLSTTTNELEAIRASMKTQTSRVDVFQESIKGVMEDTRRLTNISETLAVATTIIANTSEVTIPAETVATIQRGLVDQVAAQLKAEIKSLEVGIDVKTMQITEAATKETLIIKEDLKKFKSKYQNDQFKNLGYIEIGDDGLYMVSSSSENWVTAQRECLGKLGYLVEFTTQAEQDQVVNYLQSNDRHLDVFWLGGRDESSEGQFTWEHSQKRMGEVFSCWGEGEPNDYGHGEDCVEFTDGKWNDVSCEEDRHYICKYDTQNMVFEF